MPSKSRKSPRSYKKSAMPKSAKPTYKHRRNPARQIKSRRESWKDQDQSQYVYGKNPVIEVLRTEPRRIQKLYIAKDQRGEDKRIILIKKLAKESNTLIQYVPLQKLTGLVDVSNRHKAEFVHQGVVALVTVAPLLSLEEWIDSIEVLVSSTSRGLVIALDEVTDPHNIGAVIRVAEAMGALGVLIPRHRSGVISPVASKAASGADKLIPLVQIGNMNQALEALKNIGFWVMGSDCKPDTPVFHQFDFTTTPTVLVMGSEGKGLRESVRKSCDMLGYIPLFGRVQSLNVSTATAIMAYEIAVQQSN